MESIKSLTEKGFLNNNRGMIMYFYIASWKKDVKKIHYDDSYPFESPIITEIINYGKMCYTNEKKEEILNVKKIIKRWENCYFLYPSSPSS